MIVLGLQGEIRRSEESRCDHRLHAVLLVAQGMTCPEVSRLLGDAPRSVQYGVRRFEERGLAGLVQGQRSGRPCRLSEAQLQEVDRALRQTPRDLGLTGTRWDGETLSAWIEQRFQVRLRDGRAFFRREMDKFNTVTCWQFLKDLRAACTRTARRVVVMADNARYHRARLHQEWREQGTERFALAFLPPYSPELNPTERVWKLTHRCCLHNRYFPKLDEVTLAVENEFANWTKPNNTLHRLCAITYDAVFN